MTATRRNPTSVVRAGIDSATSRLDIQGLRMVAVVAVVLDHLVGWPSGGFVGVDVFFVISGFLITGLLLREHRRTGRISLTDFYLRRLRRIAPAAVLVLAVTTVGAFFLFNEGRFESVATDAGWALLFSANWNMAAQGTDYFQAQGPVSPFQHYWSLAVEEQFYFFWPFLMLAVFAAWQSRRPKGEPLRGVAAVVVVIAVASFAWALWESAAHPTWAYFSTFSRAWELGVGSLLAVGARTCERLPVRIRPMLAYLGLAVIIGSYLSVDSRSLFPAPLAALPVLGAALVLAAGEGGTPRFLWPLTNPVSVWIGNLSYSLYLWHFPVIVLLVPLLPTDYWLSPVLVIATTLVLATASFYGVEDPVRRSSLLQRGVRAPHEDRRGARADRRRRQGRRRALALASLGAVAVTLAGWAVITAPRSAQVASAAAVPAPAAVQITSASTPAAGEVTPPPAPPVVVQPQLTAELSAALAAAEWPELAPGVDELGRSAWAPEWYEQQCLTVWNENFEQCRWGPPDARRTAVVLGDSMAISYMPAIRGALEPAGFRVQALTMGQCPAAILSVNDFDGNADFKDYCSAHAGWSLDRIAELQPDLILASNALSTTRRLTSGASGEDAIAEFESGLSSFLQRVSASQGTVVILDPPPSGERLLDCYTRFSGPSDCVRAVDADYREFHEATRRAAEANGIGMIPTEGWFCVDGLCPSFVGTTPVFADGEHLTAVRSGQLAQVLAETLTTAGLSLDPSASAAAQ